MHAAARYMYQNSKTSRLAFQAQPTCALNADSSNLRSGSLRGRSVTFWLICTFLCTIVLLVYRLLARNHEVEEPLEPTHTQTAGTNSVTQDSSTFGLFSGASHPFERLMLSIAPPST
jgi:hypothetical protein